MLGVLPERLVSRPLLLSEKKLMASPNATPVPSRGAQYATLAAALLGW